MRVYVEFVSKDDIPWSEGVFQENCPEARYKYLSYDEISYDHSSIVMLDAGKTYESRKLNKDVELLILQGSVTTPEHEMTRGCYLRVPAGFDFPELKVGDQDAEILWMGDIGRTSEGNAEIVFMDTNQMEWEIPFVKGPSPGLFIKLLWRDPVTKAYSRLIKSAPGWYDKRIEYHDVVEEAYTFEGEMISCNWPGFMDEGCYFWRPPGILHGPMMSGVNGAVSFIRTDGELVNHYCYRKTRRPKDYPQEV